MIMVRLLHSPSFFNKSSCKWKSYLLLQTLSSFLECGEPTFSFGLSYSLPCFSLWCSVFCLHFLLICCCAQILLWAFTSMIDITTQICGVLGATYELTTYLFSDHRWVWVKNQILPLYPFVSPFSVLPILGTELMIVDWNKVL